MPNRYLIDPGKRGCRNASMGRLRALYGTQFGRIFANSALYWSKFNSTVIGRYYGLILDAAALLTRWGVGATAPTISPLYNHEPAAGQKFSGKVRVRSWQFRKKIYHAAEHFGKSPDSLLNISKKVRRNSRLFRKKRRPKTYLPMPDRPKDFAGLSKKSSARLPVFSKKVR